MARSATIPAPLQITSRSTPQGTINPGIGNFKLIPKNLDGTVFDCTAFTGATLYFYFQSQTIPAYALTQALNVVSADATGITLNLAPGSQANISDAAKGVPQVAKAFVDLDDGAGGTALAGQGNLAILYS